MTRPLRRTATLGLALAIALTASSPELKAQAPPTARAQAHFKAGSKAILAEQWAEAIYEFKLGHKIAPNAAFLYGLAVAHKGLKQYAKAREAAEAARDLGGLPKDTVVRNEALIASMHIAATAHSWRPAPIKAAAARAASPREADVRAELPDERRDQREGGFGALGYVGLSSLILGGAALAYAGYVSREVSDFRGGIDVERPSEDEVERDRELRTPGTIALLTGAGLVTTGAVLLILEWALPDETRPETARAIELTPTPGGFRAGLFVTF